MRTFQLWCTVAAIVGVVAGGRCESCGAPQTTGVIAQDETTAERESRVEEPVERPLAITRTGPEPTPAIAPLDPEQARKHQEAWATHLGVPVEWTNSIGMKLVLIPPGEFMMGSPDSDRDAQSNEKPQHRVRFSRPLYVGRCEVTQQDYERVTGLNPSLHKDEPQSSVDGVSWHHAIAFCDRISALPEEKAACRTYRLPTEAQWEYACRAGSTTPYCFGDDASQLVKYACFYETSRFKGMLRGTGQFKPNAWGLYDMHGNVVEWCEDWFDDEYYKSSPADDPTGPEAGGRRVRRGGSWAHQTAECRSARRDCHLPELKWNNLGFRVVAVLSGQQSDK